LTGVYFLARPAAGSQAWVGSTSSAARYLTAAVGGRDLAIGAGVLWSVATGNSPTPWVVASVAGDTCDAALATRMFDGPQRKRAVLAAGGFGVLGAGAIALLLA